MEKKYIQMILIIIFFIVMAIYFLFILSNNNKIFANDLPMDIYPYFHRTYDYKKTPEIIGNTEIRQTFVPDKPNMNRIDLRIGSMSYIHTEDVFMYLRDQEKPDVNIRTVIKNAKNFQYDGYNKFDFEPISDSENKKYFIIIQSPDSKRGNSISLWYDDKGSKYNNGELIIEKIFGVDCEISKKENNIENLQVYSNGTTLECQLVHSYSISQDWSMYKTLKINLKSSEKSGLHEIFLFTEEGKVIRYTIPIKTTNWTEYGIDLDNSEYKERSKIKAIRLDLNDGTQLGTYEVGSITLEGNNRKMLVNSQENFWNLLKSPIEKTIDGDILFRPYYRSDFFTYWNIILQRMSFFKPEIFNTYVLLGLSFAVMMLIVLIGVLLIKNGINK